MLAQAKSSILAKTLTNGAPLELLEEEVELLLVPELLDDEVELLLAPEDEELDEDDPPHMLLLQDQKPLGVRQLQGWNELPTLHWPGLQTVPGFEQAGRVEQPQTLPRVESTMQPHMLYVELVVL